MSHLGSHKCWRLSTGLIAVILALSMTMFGAAVNAASATHVNHHRLHAVAKHVKVMSYVYGRTASGKKVRGVFIPKSFRTRGDTLIAKGLLKGTIARHGTDRHFTKRNVRIPVAKVNGKSGIPASARANAAFPPPPPAGACNVLNLVLGPLDLNILGLQVHLNRVLLNIIAQTGAGQLLGNLLCAVAGLLDPSGPATGPLTQLQSLLTRILRALGGLSA
jgi:hypothetical protein